MSTTPPWKKLKLSLERPYKNDQGSLIPLLLDITPDGQFIYEPKNDPQDTLGAKLQRIFEERGLDYWDRKCLNQDKSDLTADADGTLEEKDSARSGPHLAMTPTELHQMRMNIMPHLDTALGEMSHARDLLTLLLGLGQTESLPNESLPPASLTASKTTIPSSIPSVASFNAHLTVGSKDSSLRLAAQLFSDASQRNEKMRKKDEAFWRDALALRLENWALVPAPLEYGARGEAKDFLVSFGLEGSPANIRRKSLARLDAATEFGLTFPNRTNKLLRISIITSTGTLRSTFPPWRASEDELCCAQTESFHLETFSLLAREATALPSAAARVSEQLVAVSPSRGVELIFELLDITSVTSIEGDPLCDIIMGSLSLLVLRTHKMHFQSRMSSAVLQPLLDILHYRTFTARVKKMLSGVLQGLRSAGVKSSMRFAPVGASDSSAIISSILSSSINGISGEAVLHVEATTMRIVLQSPATLTLHLPHVSLVLDGAIGRAESLIKSEIISAIASSIVRNREEDQGWFVDEISGRAVKKWDGGALSFRIWCRGDEEGELHVQCECAHVSRTGTKVTKFQGGQLIEWSKQIL